MKPCKNGHSVGRTKSGHCRICERLRNAARREYTSEAAKRCRARNPDRAAEISREGSRRARQDSERYARIRERTKAWRAKRAASGNTQEAEANKKWIQNNPTRYRIKAAANKAARLSATPLWSDQDVIANIYAEAARLTKETGAPYEVDHVIALVGKNAIGEHIVCGLHIETNLRIITRTENRRKREFFVPELVAASQNRAKSNRVDHA